jgi:ACS family hexuronate transporter-like MFS transporter
LLIALLLGETTINFIDRQVLSVLAPTLPQEFALSNSAYAAIVNAFLVTYAIMYTVAGRVLDRIGVGKGLTLVGVLWWSAAMWVPLEARTLAIGIRNSGSSLGAMLAPPLVAWATLTWGWRSAFVITGALGFVWVLAFQAFRRAHPELAATERTHIAASANVSWTALAKYRQTWAVFVCRFLAPPCSAPIGIFAVFSTTLFWTMAFLSIAIFCWMFWSVAFATYGIGYVVDLTHNYTLVFIGISALMPIALAAGFTLMKRVEPVEGLPQ